VKNSLRIDLRSEQIDYVRYDARWRLLLLSVLCNWP